MGPVGEEGELGQTGIRVSEATSFPLQKPSSERDPSVYFHCFN